MAELSRHAGRPRDAQRTAQDGSGPVVQFTSLRSSWSQPTLPCAVSPSRVAEPVRASELASRSVAETDSPSNSGPDLQAVQVQRARRLLHQPGDRPAEGAEVQLCDSARGTEVQARRAPHSLRGRAEKGAGDAHVVVVGRADVLHQVGGRAQNRQPGELAGIGILERSPFSVTARSEGSMRSGDCRLQPGSPQHKLAEHLCELPVLVGAPSGPVLSCGLSLSLPAPLPCP